MSSSGVNPNIAPLLKEAIRRQHDGLKMFRAMSPEISPEFPDQVSALKSPARELLLRGGNRSGKSTTAAVRFAAIARDVPVATAAGEEIDLRTPTQKGRPLLMWIVGLQMNHIGQTIYRLLFKPGLYKIIQDQETGLFRAYRPWDEADVYREYECKPSPPLIPPREIDPKGWAWESKADRQFSKCTLKNGTEIYAFASTADVKEGDPVDEIWIDEKIKNHRHYPEYQMRTSDLKGRIAWSTRTRAEPAIIQLIERAQEDREMVDSGEKETPLVEDYVFTFTANPYIDDDEKQVKIESLSDDEYRERVDGELMLYDTAVYPMFNEQLLSAIPRDPADDDQIAAVLRENGGVPPSDWTHELILDPGTAKPAVLFCATAPPHLWDGGSPVHVAYDEIYIRRAHADMLAEEIEKRVNQYGIVFERFIIDGRAARQTPMGFSGTVGSRYSEALQERGVECVQTGSYFVAGDPNFSSRSKIVASWMLPRKSGKPRLRIVMSRCPNLGRQLKNNQRKVDGEQILDTPATGQHDDVRECLEYYASRNPTYIKPPIADHKKSLYEKFLDQRNKLFGNREDSKPMNIGPGVV